MSKNDIFLKAIQIASEKNPYKVIGQYDTYSDFNQGWQACVDFIECTLEELENENNKDI